MGYVLEQAIKHHDIYVKEPFMVVEAHRAMYDKTVDNNQYEYFSNFSVFVLPARRYRLYPALYFCQKVFVFWRNFMTTMPILYADYNFRPKSS